MMVQSIYPVVLAAVAVLSFAVAALVPRKSWALSAWGVGVLALGIGAALAIPSAQRQVLSDFFVALNMGLSAKTPWLGEAAQRDAPLLVGYAHVILPVLAVVAVLATPFVLLGALFHADRPIGRTPAVFLLAVAIGGLLLAAALAAGLDGYGVRNIYYARLATEDVLDGDSLIIRGQSVRLAGIDAPEGRSDSGDPSANNQVCYSAGQRSFCGQEARRALAAVIKGALVLCRRVEDYDKYGRFLASCRLHGGEHDGADPAALMVAGGFAVLSREGSEGYQDDEERAKREKRGVWGTCMVHPDDWRNRKDVREAFITTPPVWAPSMVIVPDACPPATKVEFSDLTARLLTKP